MQLKDRARPIGQRRRLVDDEIAVGVGSVARAGLRKIRPWGNAKQASGLRRAERFNASTVAAVKPPPAESPAMTIFCALILLSSNAL